jgi:hypothetical protein
VAGDGLELPLGPHSLRLSAEGFAEAASAVELTAGHPVVRFSAVLRPATGEKLPEGFLALGGDVVPPRRITGALPAAPEGGALAGSAVVDAYVRETGEVARVVEVMGHECLSRALAAAIRTWRFRPAERGGVPVAARLRVQHVFLP